MQGDSARDAMSGDLDRRGLQLAMTDALADILRWEATAIKAARH